MLNLSLLHEVHHKLLLFILVKETFYQLYHPRMASSPRPLLRSTVLQVHNNGKIPYMERQAGQDIRCVHVTLHLTVTGLSRMSINPFTSFNSPTVPDKPYVMKLTTLCSVRITLWGKPLQDPCPCHNKLLLDLLMHKGAEKLQHGDTLWRLAGLIHYLLDLNTHPEAGKLYLLILVNQNQ